LDHDAAFPQVLEDLRSREIGIATLRKQGHGFTLLTRRRKPEGDEPATL
jgi:hypothetical protein